MTAEGGEVRRQLALEAEYQVNCDRLGSLGRVVLRESASHQYPMLESATGKSGAAAHSVCQRKIVIAVNELTGLLLKLLPSH